MSAPDRDAMAFFIQHATGTREMTDMQLITDMHKDVLDQAHTQEDLINILFSRMFLPLALHRILPTVLDSTQMSLSADAQRALDIFIIELSIDGKDPTVHLSQLMTTLWNPTELTRPEDTCMKLLVPSFLPRFVSWWRSLSTNTLKAVFKKPNALENVDAIHNEDLGAFALTPTEQLSIRPFEGQSVELGTELSSVRSPVTYTTYSDMSNYWTHVMVALGCIGAVSGLTLVLSRRVVPRKGLDGTRISASPSHEQLTDLRGYSRPIKVEADETEADGLDTLWGGLPDFRGYSRPIKVEADETEADETEADGLDTPWGGLPDLNDDDDDSDGDYILKESSDENEDEDEVDD